MKCKHCGQEKDSVSRGSGLCYACEEYYVPCGVCETWIHADNAMTHKHLWWDEQLGWWMGPGYWYETKHSQAAIRDSLYALCDMLGAM